MDDRELLQEYREHQSEKAFAELVSRHVRLVYATALRLTGERQAAEDVVQAVFLLLARKSWMVRDGNALPGWLYRATQRTAFNEKRREERRRQRETEAMNNAELDAKTQAMLAKLLPLLDEALGQLSSVEQNLIVLRFFENKSLRETGATAGLSEQATHNRISRAVEKLRQYFARSGVTVASAGVETALTAPSSQAVPVGLVAKVTGAALAGSGAALGIGDIVLKFFFTMNTKTQVALVVVVVALIALPFLRSANVPENAPAVVSNSSLAQPTTPVVTPQIAAAQTPTVVQPSPPTAAPESAAASSPTAQVVAQVSQQSQVSGPTQPRAPQAAGSTIEISAPQSDFAEAQRYASTHPLSHNMGVRITGTLGPNNPVDVTLVGNRRSNREILYEPQNGIYPRDQPVPTRGTFSAAVSPRNGSYQVTFAASLMYQQGVRGSGANGVAILQPGESTTAVSDDGQINLKATLIEISTTDSQINAQSNAAQNLLVQIRGTILTGYPFDISLASAPPIPNILATGSDEIHSIGTNILDDGIVQPVQETTRLQITPPEPNSDADPGSYEIQYLLQPTPPGTTVNAAGKTVQLFNGVTGGSGLVLLKVGQTVTVQDVAGVGNIEISLSTADY